VLVEIPLSRWYAKDNVDVGDSYSPQLENYDGQCCCLGFCAASRGVKSESLIDEGDPHRISHLLPLKEWMLGVSYDPMLPLLRCNSYLACLAISLNDGEPVDPPRYGGIGGSLVVEDLPTRMGNLITVFAEGGDDLQFIYDL
jgi:hypothetical protein